MCECVSHELVDSNVVGMGESARGVPGRSAKTKKPREEMLKRPAMVRGSFWKTTAGPFRWNSGFTVSMTLLEVSPFRLREIEALLVTVSYFLKQFHTNGVMNLFSDI